MEEQQLDKIAKNQTTYKRPPKEYWVCMVGPIKLPPNKSGLDLPFRTAVEGVFEKVFNQSSSILSSGWGVSQKKFELLNYIWSFEEDEKDFQDLWEKYKEGIEFIRDQVNKDGNFTGKNEVLHEVDVEISVEEGTATTRKNRFNYGNKTFNVFESNNPINLVEFRKVYKGEDFQRIRLNAGLSIGKMADLLGVNQKSIYNWENNISSPPNLHLNIYQKLDEKVKIYKSQNNKEPINDTLKQLLVFGGISAILWWLFKDQGI